MKEGAANSNGDAFQVPIHMQGDHENKFTALTQIMIFGKIQLYQKGRE